MMKREAVEASVGYLADELDLLGLYLTTLLNIGDVEPDVELTLPDMSAPLDTYYNSLDAGVTLDKPRPATSPLFASIFSQLELRGAARWTEIGVALNMFSPDDQSRITKMLAKLEKRVHMHGRRISGVAEAATHSMQAPKSGYALSARCATGPSKPLPSAAKPSHASVLTAIPRVFDLSSHVAKPSSACFHVTVTATSSAALAPSNARGSGSKSDTKRCQYLKLFLFQ